MDVSSGLYVRKNSDSVKTSDLQKIFNRFQVPNLLRKFPRQPHITEGMTTVGLRNASACAPSACTCSCWL